MIDLRALEVKRGLRYSIEDPIRCYKCTLGNTSRAQAPKFGAICRISKALLKPDLAIFIFSCGNGTGWQYLSKT
ncbi:hypothetical protein KCV06_g418, partial [Aureobasidium melanogenum]